MKVSILPLVIISAMMAMVVPFAVRQGRSREAYLKTLSGFKSGRYRATLAAAIVAVFVAISALRSAFGG